MSRKETDLNKVCFQIYTFDGSSLEEEKRSSALRDGRNVIYIYRRTMYSRKSSGFTELNASKSSTLRNLSPECSSVTALVSWKVSERVVVV